MAFVQAGEAGEGALGDGRALVGEEPASDAGPLGPEGSLGPAWPDEGVGCAGVLVEETGGDDVGVAGEVQPVDLVSGTGTTFL